MSGGFTIGKERLHEVVIGAMAFDIARVCRRGHFLKMTEAELRACISPTIWGLYVRQAKDLLKLGWHT